MGICQEVLSLLTDHLCKNVKGNGDETEVFYLKMCGDYYRYLSEFKTEPEDKAKDIKANAEKFYKEAMDVAEANLNQRIKPKILKRMRKNSTKRQWMSPKQI